jgi:tetratricopeptide (TPR) repeat protein
MSPAIAACTFLIACLAERGEFEEGLAVGPSTLEAAEDLNHSFTLTLASWAVGFLYVRMGEFEKAIPVLGRGLEVCESQQIRALFPRVASTLGYAYALGSRATDGLPLLKRAAAVAGAPGSRYLADQSRRVVWLGEAHLLMRQVTEATRSGEQALDLSRRLTERGNEAYALYLLGQIAAHADPPEAQQADSHYRQALALAEALGMRPLVAHCYLGLGMLYREVGRREQAQAELTTAAELYCAMAMNSWSERAQAELAEAAH